MDFSAQLEAFQQNIDAHNRGVTPIQSWELISILNDIGDRWRVAWEMMPRDQVFDSLYAYRGNDSKRPFLFRRDPHDVSTHAIICWDEDNPGEPTWWPYEGPQQIVDWLVEIPPFIEMTPIAALYEHARGIEKKASPWVLMMGMIGQRPIERVHETVAIGDIHVGAVDLYDLMPIGDNDGLPLAQALQAWALSTEIARSYIHLIDAYDSHLNESPEPF
jgi:hypothetical protein